jgi:periplasmic copper chaperone A
MTRRIALSLSLVVALAMAGCSSSALPSTTAGGFLTLSGAWTRPAAAGAETAAYLTITNGQLRDDVLVGASTPVAASASLHQTSTDASGMTGMKMVDSIRLPAGQTVRLEPGGLHIMLTGLKQELTVGSRVPLTLTFEQTGPVNVTAEVRAS